MQRDSIQFPAGTQWVHRGTLPQLTLAQARLALEISLLTMPECVFISTDEPLLAGMDLSSGRLVRSELIRHSDDIGVMMTFEDVHEEDLVEVARLHDDIVRRYPEAARSVRGVAIREVA